MASVVLLLSILIGGNMINSWEYGYTISVSIMGICVGILLLLLQLGTIRGGDEDLGTIPHVGMMTPILIINGIALIWWGIGCLIITFQGPFLLAGNGFFAAWLGVICAAWPFGYQEELYKKMRWWPSLCLTFCSFIVMIQTSSYIASGSRVDLGEVIFGLVASLLSMLLIALFALMEGLAVKCIAFVLCAIWISTAITLTFAGPTYFVALSNSYFACWIGLITTVVILAEALGMDRLDLQHKAKPSDVNVRAVGARAVPDTEMPRTSDQSTQGDVVEIQVVEAVY